ncbi:MAG TPA: guanylate kinase [Abditibacteriaceae bacterium]|jgi:guanylate kinase
MSIETSPQCGPLQRGLLLVLSGPAGVGKDTVWKVAAPCLPTFAKATTCTTRAQRPGEVDGVHYFFLPDEKFDTLIAENQLLEWAWVHGNRYGVPVSSVMQRLEAGGDVICIIEVQGALKIRSMIPDSMLVFLKPPPGREEDVLKERIRGRGAEDEEQIARRMETAAWELCQTKLYDHEIINDEIEFAAQQLCDLVNAEKKKREEHILH